MVAPMRWRDLLAEGRGPLTVGILLVEFVAAIEALVVVAIMPAVRRDLGGLEFYGLVFSGYALAALAATPTSGRVADRYGPAMPFLIWGALFVVGTILSGLAVSMPALAGARIVQGYGAGGAFTIAFSAVARTYPEAGQARILALLATVWILPGIVGPSFGTLLATTVGWRWAFIAIIPPTILAMAMTVPGLARLSRTASTPSPLSLRWPIQLALGVAIGVTGLSVVSFLTAPAVVVGALLIWPSLRRILPAGSFSARPGQPAVIAGIFLLSMGFFTADYFVPLLITGVLGGSLAQAGIAVTLISVSWAVGSWWQARAIRRLRHATLVRLGSVPVGAGIAVLVLIAVAGAPVWVVYVAWTVTGLGMGVAYPTLYLMLMRAAAGAESTAVSAGMTADRLSQALGGGLGGGAIALASAAHAPLSLGLAVAFALGLAGSAGALTVTPRLNQPGVAEPAQTARLG